MELALLIYFIDVICGDWVGLGFLLLMIALSGSLIWIALLVISSGIDSNPEDVEKAKELLRKTTGVKTLIVFCWAVLSLSGFIPERETAYKMLAAYGIQEVATSEAAGRLAPKSLEFLELTLDKELLTLKKSVSKDTLSLDSVSETNNPQ